MKHAQKKYPLLLSTTRRRLLACIQYCKARLSCNDYVRCFAEALDLIKALKEKEDAEILATV
jgi:hypothetical protein